MSSLELCGIACKMPTSGFEDTPFNDDVDLVEVFYSGVLMLISTIGVDFKIRTIEQDGKTIKLQIVFAYEIGISITEASAKSATNVEQAFMAISVDIKTRLIYARCCKMANQPSANTTRPPSVQLEGQPVNQKGGCCSS